jgi:hypothetical protein
MSLPEQELKKFAEALFQYNHHGKPLPIMSGDQLNEVRQYQIKTLRKKIQLKIQPTPTAMHLNVRVPEIGKFLLSSENEADLRNNAKDLLDAFGESSQEKPQ